MRDPMSWHVIEETGRDGIPEAAPEQPRQDGGGTARPGHATAHGEPGPGPLGALGGGPAIARLALAAAAGAVIAAALVLAAGGSGAPVVAVDAAGIALPTTGRGTPGPGASARSIGGPDGTTGSSADAAGQGLLVDVEGAVERPGVVRLPAGARVGDAIEAAGGYAPSVDVDRAPVELNLAAPVSDGERVHVPAVGDPPAGVVVTSGSTASAAPGDGSDGSDVAATGPLDLNHATQVQLEALPGIGPVTARKIIDARDAAAFAAVDDLRTRKLVGAATYAKIAPLVTVGP
jgi:competence protein ComEA